MNAEICFSYTGALAVIAVMLNRRNLYVVAFCMKLDLQLVAFCVERDLWQRTFLHDFRW